LSATHKRESVNVPEIRLTFPEEIDASGKRQSRVVVVKIGDNGGVGLEPCAEETLSAQTFFQTEWKSLDLEKMGGLRDRADEKPQRWL